MYVVPTWRGQDLGYLMLTHLEDLAASTGAREAILETGSLNTAALRLYELAGYQRTAPYVPGRLDINRAFAKPLAAKAGELPRPA
jgi:GNAT superfamily N-acetyltransferase